VNQLIAVDTPATLRAVFYPAGSDTGADDDPVTVAVVNSNGDAVAGVGATVSPGDGVYTATLPAQENLDILTATWTGATTKVRTTHEIVGRQIVELAEIRALPNMANTGTYPNAMLEDARAWFTDLVEDYCGFSPIPRFARETVNGTGRPTVDLATRSYVRAIRSITVDGVAVADVADWFLSEGVLIGPETLAVGVGNVAVAYEHGLDGPPADLRRAALTAIRYRILTDVNSQMPDRALSLSNEFGNVQMAQAGRRTPVGIPEVDSVLSRMRLVSVG
jgi:hypothetical protein